MSGPLPKLQTAVPALKPPQISGAQAGILLLRLKRLMLKNVSNPLTHTQTSLAARGRDNTLVTGNKAKQYFT